MSPATEPRKQRRKDPFTQLGDLPQHVNIAHYLPQMAAEHPQQDAVIQPRGKAWQRVSYAELEQRSNAIARGMASLGIERGMRVCLFVKPGIDLIAITYALFKLGTVPVLADPGMGRKRLLAAVEKMRPEVFVGIPLAQIIRNIFPKPFATVRTAITVGRGPKLGGVRLSELEREHAGPFECAQTASSDEAAILFTSGSTGPPKGVVYTHGMFNAQVHALDALYQFEPGERDLACFPLFALFNTALAMTSVIPRMNVSKPARVRPENIIAAITTHSATTTFGSPAIWKRVVPYCIKHGVKLPTLRRVLIAGAPVPPALIADFHRVLSDAADVHTPYGATESLPVASAAGRAIVNEYLPQVRSGAGTCVGKPAPGIELSILGVTDDPIDMWDPALEVPAGEWGEVCVRGPVVTHEYRHEPEHTRAAKMRDPLPGNAPWHRLGDVGYVDAEGRLWFGGRKSHRLETANGMRMPVPTENVFNELPDVARTALVGVGAAGSQVPVLCIELDSAASPGPMGRKRVIEEVQAAAKQHELGRDIEHFLIHPSFPVDVRHNAKIHREQLREWATRMLA